MNFVTEQGITVPYVTYDEMREADRIAVNEFGLGILQMMENAGRSLAENAVDMLGSSKEKIVFLCGGGNNGGGGLCCARHLLNRGFDVTIILNREVENLGNAALNQYHILRTADINQAEFGKAEEYIRSASLVVDALIGYGLKGKPEGKAAELINLMNMYAERILSLDVPSGINTDLSVIPERTLTLAMPKHDLFFSSGSLYLSDIGIPDKIFARIGIEVPNIYQGRWWVKLFKQQTKL